MTNPNVKLPKFQPLWAATALLALSVTARSDDTPATSYRRVWSPGCSELLPRLLELPAHACETRLGFAGDFFIPGRWP